MNAKETVESLLKLGVHMKSAFSDFNLGTGKGWIDFLDSPSAAQAENDMADVLEKLTLADIEIAVSEIRAKEKAFLNGRKISALTVEELGKFHALLDLENVLVLKEIQRLGSLKFWQWLVNDALPILINVAKIALPLLV